MRLIYSKFPVTRACVGDACPCPLPLWDARLRVPHPGGPSYVPASYVRVASLSDPPTHAAAAHLLHTAAHCTDGFTTYEHARFFYLPRDDIFSASGNRSICVPGEPSELTLEPHVSAHNLDRFVL